jgi:hypothetical protein
MKRQAIVTTTERSQFELVAIDRNEIPSPSQEFKRFLSEVRGVKVLSPLTAGTLERQVRDRYGDR